jgi:thiol-disulfide isomerase/thioredoxin
MKNTVSIAGLLLVAIHATNAFVTNPPTKASSNAPRARSLQTTFMSTTATKMTKINASSEGTVIDLADSNFAELFHSPHTPLLIDAYSTWCGPCKLIEPIIQKCATDYGSSSSDHHRAGRSPPPLTVARWNVEAPSALQVKIELLLQGANPSKLPTLILAYGGKANIIHEGLISQDQLNDLLAERLPTMTTTTNTQKEIQPESRKAIKNDANLQRRQNLLQNSKRQAGFISFMSLDHPDDYMMQM